MALYLDAIIAGFGGQGVMLIGNLLAYAGMEAGYNVTYIPVYGPEMRGGTANCTVVISDEPIGSPIIKRPLSCIIMNLPSLHKFQPTVQDGGVVVVNSSLVNPALGDAARLKIVPVAANEIADALGNVRMANMVALGAWLRATNAIPLETVQQALPNVIAAHYAKLIPANANALARGWETADAAMATA